MNIRAINVLSEKLNERRSDLEWKIEVRGLWLKGFKDIISDRTFDLEKIDRFCEEEKAKYKPFIPTSGDYPLPPDFSEIKPHELYWLNLPVSNNHHIQGLCYNTRFLEVNTTTGNGQLSLPIFHLKRSLKDVKGVIRTDIPIWDADILELKRSYDLFLRLTDYSKI
jgi:hypothetical protein